MKDHPSTNGVLCTEEQQIRWTQPRSCSAATTVTDITHTDQVSVEQIDFLGRVRVMNNLHQILDRPIQEDR